MVRTIKKPFINWSNLPILVNRLYSYKQNTNQNDILELDVNTNDYNMFVTGGIGHYHIGLDKSNIIINSNIEFKYLAHKYKYEYRIDEKCEYNYNIDRLNLKYSLDQFIIR